MFGKIDVARVLGFGFVLGLLGCDDDGTESAAVGVLVVEVDTELEPQEDFDAATLFVTGPSLPARREVLDLGAIEFPTSVRVEADKEDEARVQLELESNGAALLTREVLTRILLGESKKLEIFIPSSCLNQACEAEQSCGNDGVCAGINVDAEELPNAD